MDYIKIFKEKEKEELVEVLNDYQLLNIDAKYALKRILEEDESLSKEFPNRLDEINQSLELEEEGIRSLQYLTNLGFKFSKPSENSIKITRKISFILVDLVTMVVGFLLMFNSAFSAYSKWLSIFSEGLDALILVGAIISTVFSAIGLVLFMRGISRLFEFTGFLILKDATGINIRKRSDLSLEEFNAEATDFELVNEDDKYALIYRHEDREIPLIQTNGGEKLKRTLVQLKELLTAS